MRRFLGFAIVLAVVELLVIIEVAQAIGALNTLGLLILVSVLGALIVKAQGLAALRRVITDVETRRVPGATLADGALLVAAGVLLVVPGFLTDIPGLLLLIPPVRTGVRRSLSARWTRRFIDVRGNVRSTELPPGRWPAR
ncbi:MAG TPA: FxsA family protein [Acidimicrobiia bacterium]|jgi:UPF0716 protein FxsA|nr:FxsA family protein [Acidimicrobiia bacterium]